MCHRLVRLVWLVCTSFTACLWGNRWTHLCRCLAWIALALPRLVWNRQQYIHHHVMIGCGERHPLSALSCCHGDVRACAFILKGFSLPGFVLQEDIAALYSVCVQACVCVCVCTFSVEHSIEELLGLSLQPADPRLLLFEVFTLRQHRAPSTVLCAVFLHTHTHRAVSK